MAAFGCLIMGNACQQRSNKGVSRVDSPADSGTTDTVTNPLGVQFVFGDSVNRAFFWDQMSELRETGPKSLRMNGLSVIYIEKAPLPFELHTALMDIEVLELPILLRVDAFDKEAGQSLELFSGGLKVEKSYESDFPSLDTLHAGDLYMINKDIDLSEKEYLDDFSVQNWWEAYSLQPMAD